MRRAPKTSEIEWRQYHQLLRTHPEQYLRIAEDTIRQYPDDPRGYLDCVSYWMDLEEYDCALCDIDSALALRESTMTRYRRGVVLRCLGRYQEAIDEFNRVEAADPRTYATLLEDLSQRGMLDSTIVLVTGEFGRTPEINVNGGRDHWPTCFSVTIAGGGIEGGRVIGASDKDGMFITDNPVQVSDFMATIYKKLGINPEKEYISNIGRPFKLADKGKPIDFLLT